MHENGKLHVTDDSVRRPAAGQPQHTFQLTRTCCVCTVEIFSTIHMTLSQSSLLCHGCWTTFLNLLHDVSKLRILFQLCQLLLDVSSVAGIVHALHEIGHLWVLLLQPQKEMLECCKWPDTYMLKEDSI